MAAVLALAAAPDGFTVAQFTEKVHAMTGQTEQPYTIRQGAYDLRKLRGKQVIDKPGRYRRYHTPLPAARTIAAPLTLREQVIGLILAGIRSPRQGRKPKHWTRIDRDRSASTCRPSSTTSRSPAPRHSQHIVDRDPASS